MKHPEHCDPTFALDVEGDVPSDGKRPYEEPYVGSLTTDSGRECELLDTQLEFFAIEPSLLLAPRSPCIASDTPQVV